MRTLSKEPGPRPATAAEFANELGWVLHHDLGAAQAAILRMRVGDQRPRYSLVLPGSHRLGTGDDADLQLGEGEPGIRAVIEWAGAPKEAELAASGPGVKVGGQEITERVSWAAGTSVQVGEVELELTYPRS